MAVVRVNKTKDFTVMSNKHLRDKSLSLKGKGLLSVMLSLPDDWDYSINGLSAISSEGTKAIRSILGELETLGYLVRTRTQNEKGQFDYIYDIYEYPQPQNQEPYTPEGHTDKGYTAGGTQYNTNQSNTDKPNTNNKEERKTATANSFDILIDKYLSDDGINYKYSDADERRELLQDWLKVRKAKRAAMTDRAIELNLQKLDKLAGKSNMSVVEYLKEVICRGWQAFYEIKDYSKPQQSKQPVKENLDFDRKFGKVL